MYAAPNVCEQFLLKNVLCGLDAHPLIVTPEAKASGATGHARLGFVAAYRAGAKLTYASPNSGDCSKTDF
jgi:hypothetical protein